MAMLACLWELAPRLRLTLEVAAIDHGLRAGAAAELALVAERAAALGLPFHVRRVDVAAARERSPESDDGVPAGRGVQEVARRLRLAALSDLLTERNLDRVALGHQADDQVETVLFRIMRGTGVAGLAGIPYMRAPFVRPLLDVTRAQIQRYLGRRSIPFATDPSNVDPHYARARIRQQILPALRRENPRVDEALRRLAASAAGGKRRAAALAPGPLPAGVHVSGRAGEAIDAAARDGRGTRWFDVEGGRVRVSYGQVHVERAGPPTRREATDQPLPAPLLTVAQAGCFRTGPTAALVVREVDGQGPGGFPRASEDSVPWAWFDGDGLAWPLHIRTIVPGDRMFPRGSTGGRKLSDLLIDAKVPRAERAALPVVTDGEGTILFVPGLRPSRTGTPGPATHRRIGLAVVPISAHDGSVDPSIVTGNTQRYRDPKGLL